MHDEEHEVAAGTVGYSVLVERITNLRRELADLKETVRELDREMSAFRNDSSGRTFRAVLTACTIIGGLLGVALGRLI